ncbi:MAG: 2-hydroxyacyl-CoA dehydratase [Candidatus Lokiarchaeota archaeon]|nr:2-hydroxyacyl-CoA dehydratase [Candidatus Lokiarchaeota archaeon]
MHLKDDPFLNVSNSISNSYIEDWQALNKKIIGYYCTYIPEELLHAAGILPYRIRATGNKDTELADTYMVRFTCSFVRSTLDLALKGAYNFMDGFLICNSCDHSRRMFEIFDLKVFNKEKINKKINSFYLSIPHIITEEGFNWYLKEIEELREKLEVTYNCEITDDVLNHSLDIYNQNRDLLKKLHELQIQEFPKITGTEALQISMANASVPKEIANEELKRILNDLELKEGMDVSSKKRIINVGSVVDNIDFIQLIENSGTFVASDFICFGTRNFHDTIDFDYSKEPLKNLTKRLYYRISCPRMMDDHENRLKFLKEEIKNANIDGVILQRINNCDLHGCDNMLFTHELKELDIPVLNIDRESYQADTTRLQTRIEAFIEMIR